MIWVFGLVSLSPSPFLIFCLFARLPHSHLTTSVDHRFPESILLDPKEGPLLCLSVDLTFSGQSPFSFPPSVQLIGFGRSIGHSSHDLFSLIRTHPSSFHFTHCLCLIETLLLPTPLSDSLRFVSCLHILNSFPSTHLEILTYYSLVATPPLSILRGRIVH